MSAAPERTAPYDVSRVKQDFPIFRREMNGKPLVYLDTASSAQTPTPVLDALRDFYENHYANVHRGVYQLSAEATAMHDAAREKVRELLGAAEAREIVFTRNTTESLNLVAYSLGRHCVREGDEVLVSAMEHHANLVPWQVLCEERGARLRVAPIDDDGALRMDELEARLGPRTKIVAITHVSNALGSINPIAEISRLAHAHGAYVVVDGAQSVPRFPVDVQQLGCDFFAFSGHKLYGPTGIGVLWGRADLLGALPPYQTGGSMIASVSFEKTTYADIPFRFEAGTPDIAGAIGLAAAIDYVAEIGLDRIAAHEDALTREGAAILAEVPGLRAIGTARERTGVLSFVMDGIHPHDVGTILDQEGIAIRAGHHCAQPLMERFDVAATVRASVGLYNDHDDLVRLAAGLRKAREIFG